MKVQCEVSLGELLDKLSILYIKNKKITDETKLKHVRLEIEKLEETLKGLALDGYQELLAELEKINLKLWVIEDDIRDKERNKEFDQQFIGLARAVYITNDQRFECKNKINKKYSSTIVEVKSYQQY